MGIVTDYAGEPAAFSKTYTSFAADTDLVSEGGRHARRIRIGIGGTLAVVYDGGREDLITYQSGDIDALAITAIKSTSSAENVTVYW